MPNKPCQTDVGTARICLLMRSGGLGGAPVLFVEPLFFTGIAPAAAGFGAQDGFHLLQKSLFTVITGPGSRNCLVHYGLSGRGQYGFVLIHRVRTAFLRCRGPASGNRGVRSVLESKRSWILDDEKRSEGCCEGQCDEAIVALSGAFFQSSHDRKKIPGNAFGDSRSKIPWLLRIATRYNRDMPKNTLTPLILLPFLLLGACDGDVPDASSSPSPAPSPSSARAFGSGEKPHDVSTLTATLAGKFGRSWQLVSRFENGTDNTQECYKDDQVMFFIQHRIDFNVGANACRRGELVDTNQTGTWQPTSEYDLLLFVGDAPYQAKILELTNTKLVMSFIDVDGSQVVETYQPGKELTSYPSLGSIPTAGTGAKPPATPKPAATPVVLNP